jgi:hypothetical protein
MTIDPSVVANSNLLINLDASLYALRADNVHEGEPHECTHRNAEQKPFHASTSSLCRSASNQHLRRVDHVSAK